MTKFIHTSNGQYINVDTIESIGEVRTERGDRIVLTTKGGTIHYASFGFEPEHLTATILPAAPGLAGLVPDEDESGNIEKFLEYPVVAWRISVIYNAQPEPVCPTDIGISGVLYPDGRVEDFNAIYPNVEAFRVELNDRKAKERAIRESRQKKGTVQ